MRVHIVGTGLIGASLGIALSNNGFDVTLEDPSPVAVGLARDLGAGSLGGADLAREPDLVVVAAPPDVTAVAVASALDRFTQAAVTDVASVKQSVLDALRGSGADITRYVGAHPMAGRERSGAAAARADLFEGRAFVVVPHEGSDPAAVALVTDMARRLGSVVTQMNAEEHDAAVAAVSHVPQVASTLVAALLREQPEPAVGLAGQGLRDVTRIAASDPRLWTQILAGNAAAVRDGLRQLQRELTEVLTALDGIVDGSGEGSLGTLSRALEHGNLGHARIPGKHGAAPTAYAVVAVFVPDEPGALGRLFNDMGEAQINLEDLVLDHGLGLPFATAEISVVPAAEEPLRTWLASRGWRLRD